LFEFKYRTKAAIKITDEGDGIGLSIAHFIVSKFGGQILVRTDKDKNIFTISVPKYIFRPPEK